MKKKKNSRPSPRPPKNKRLEIKPNQRTTKPTNENVELGTKTQGKPKFDAVPDRVDVRDWLYQPALAPLPDILINCDSVPDILDQGSEGACTGFALAAVINYHLHKRSLKRYASERMLYEMARRYDEWAGEDYEGSSARGAMKGWVAHGVCERDRWPKDQHGVAHFDETLAQNAMGTPGGAYYRVMHRQVRDMHAALHEAGIIYVTLMVHDGWFEPGGEPQLYTYMDGLNLQKDRPFPIIQRKGRANSGHAVAFVGYTPHGFIVQNSWGTRWGANGFALLPYEDYLLHSTDVWVAQLGVPVLANLWKLGNADTTAGLQRATPSVPLADIRPYVIDIGNDGALSGSGKYWTTEDDLKRLFNETIPKKTQSWSKKRVMLYLHGGLNDEEAVARRIVAFRDICLENEIYPLHIMWETGWKETLNNIIADRFGRGDDRAGSLLDNIRGELGEARDWSFEHTVSLPGTALWDEMKENGQFASTREKGGVQVLVKYVKAAMANLDAAGRKQWELHLVGHSAGSIFAAHAIEPLLSTGVTFKTLQFMAPAMTVDLFKAEILDLIENGKAPHPTIYLLDDDTEKDDTVWIYGKSLLYLVSNAFERERGKPILGMQRFVQKLDHDDNEPDPDVAKLLAGKVDGLPSLVVAGRAGDGASSSASRTHGGFDNDALTLNSVLRRILGLKDADPLPRPFDQKRDLSYG